LLIAGPSGSGKSNVAAGFLERLAEHKYQFCIIDPEGDHETIEGAVTQGSSQHGPKMEEVLQLLKDPEENVVVNLVGLPIADRPAFFLTLLHHLQEMRARTGRPHWLLVDETHHVLPASRQAGSLTLPGGLDRVILITVDPHQVAAAGLSIVDTLIVVGDAPETTLRQFCEAIEESPPAVPHLRLQSGEALFWARKSASGPFRLHIAPSQTERRRHRRKYAEGELGPEKSFYFRGPEGKLNLRAQNLFLFIQMAGGVDDDTWVYHLQRGDYSRWFREKIRDDILAAEAARIEELANITPAESRKLISSAIEQRYTLPSSSTLSAPRRDSGNGPA
jgi:hypothetical protein